MNPVRGVAEIALNVRDLDAMVAFYTTVLGFVEFWPDPEPEGVPRTVRPGTAGPGTAGPGTGRPTIVFLRIGGDSAPPAREGAAHAPLLVLIDPARHPRAAGEFGTPRRECSTLNHIAFDIDPADHAPQARRLASMGIEVTTVEFDWLNAKSLFFRDPEGNEIELICRRGRGS